MVTISTQPIAKGSSPDASECPHCHRQVRWMGTFLGVKMAFQIDPVPRRLDDGAGWIPGLFLLSGRWRRVLAPLHAHSSDKARRAQTVLHLHNCRVAA